MIQLPDNFLNMAYVDKTHNRLLLHMKNEVNQYFTYFRVLDKAMTFDEHLEAVRQHDFSSASSYTLSSGTMETMQQEPLDQHWTPAPVPFDEVTTLAQFKAEKALSNV
jgi:hypothetical protein